MWLITYQTTINKLTKTIISEHNPYLFKFNLDKTLNLSECIILYAYRLSETDLEHKNKEQ